MITGPLAHMHRNAHFSPWKQLRLGLPNGTASAESASLLRAAYGQLELSQRMTFRQVMSNRALAIGVRNIANAIARRRARGGSSDGALGTDEMIQERDVALEVPPEDNDGRADKGDC